MLTQTVFGPTWRGHEGAMLRAQGWRAYKYVDGRDMVRAGRWPLGTLLRAWESLKCAWHLWRRT